MQNHSYILRSFLPLAFCFGVGTQASYFAQEAAVLIKVPVVDCLGAPAEDIDLSLKGDSQKVVEFYAYLPFSPEAGSYSCPRIHQCVYNEAGIVKQEKGDELLIEFPHFYYSAQGISRSDFWLHKETIQRIKDLDSALLAYIPEPLTPKSIPTQDVLALMVPWKDEKSSISYSAGTRFLRNKSADSDTHYGIFVIDYAQNRVHTEHVPYAEALIEGSCPLEDSKKLFVHILRTWIAHQKEEIAYVWGGTTYIHRCLGNDFYAWEGNRGTDVIRNWKRPVPQGVQTGFDCSGLVLRAAQLAGIRYFCKNTTTVGLALQDLPSHEPLEVGDLILIYGHVMVVSDPEKNLFIDAAGYGMGFGCLREAPISSMFLEVAHYEDLRAMALVKQPLGRKNRKGEPFGTASPVRILRLRHLDS